MKKLFFLSFIVIIITVSCKNEGGVSVATKKNLEVNEAIMKAYEAGDFSKMKEYIAADAVDHGGDHGDVKGLDSIVAAMKVYRAQMPDMKTIRSRSLGDDEYVFTWATISGTMMGKSTTMSSVDVTKFKDGKATEHWIFMDPKELMQMMQSIPADVAKPVTDSLKK